MPENPICHRCNEKTEALPQLRPDAESKRWYGCKNCDGVYEYRANPATGQLSVDCELLLVGIEDYLRQQKHHWERYFK